MINDYLWFGYCPRRLQSSPPALPPLQGSVPHDYTERSASGLLDLVFDRILERLPAKHHLVPLSGGWDSRLILAMLVDRVGAGAVEAVTFGCPGQLDFDLACKVAKATGVRHHLLDLNQVEVAWASIIESVSASPWTYVPDALFNQLARRILGSGRAIWSGFMGDPLTGSHLAPEGLTAREAKSLFVNRQRRGKHLSEDTYVPSIDSAGIGSWPYDPYCWYDLAVRQANCIFPIVTGLRRWTAWDPLVGCDANGNPVVAPFLDAGWARYWLGAPRSMLLDQGLYVSMARMKFPTIFEIPGKATLGLPGAASYRRRLKGRWIWLIKRLSNAAPLLVRPPVEMNNYLDFDRALRTRADYVQVTEIAVEVLEKRNAVPWLDVRRISQLHRSGRQQNGQQLLVLIGLAANLEANRA